MKKKSAAKKISKASNRFPDLKLTLPFELADKQNKFVLIGASVLSIIAGLMYVLPMKSAIGVFSFPLDDPWIHLNFAKNLAEFGKFSYFHDSMVTSGSTSPLYTFLAAIIWKFSHDEFFLSFFLGILFFALSSIYLYKVSRFFFEKEQWISIGITVAFILTGRIDAISVSGMETTLFIFVLLATLFYYLTNKQILFATFSGLLLWSRPDGLILLFAIILHFIYTRYLVSKKDRASEESLRVRSMKSLFTPGIIFFVLVAGYFLFNLLISGSFFPNTMMAKIKYYGGGAKPEYFNDMVRFYSSSVLGVFIGFFVVALIAIIIQLIKRQNLKLLPLILFVVGMIVAYWIEIPFLYQDGRYLIPTIHFYLIIGVWGMRQFFRWILQLLPSPMIIKFGNVMSIGLILLAIILGITKWNEKRKDHYEMCRYIYDRQVTAGKWIKDNTPATSIIATHDIGAIGFYSDRRIVDMVGLVTPEMIQHIGDLIALEKFMKTHKVTHVAVLRNWFEVVNQKAVFMTNEKIPEIMEIFRFIPGVTHIMPQIASSLNTQAAQLLQAGRLQEAFQYLEQSYKIDPKSTRTLALLGIASAAAGDTVNAEKALQSTLSLQPDFIPAIMPLAKLYSSQKRYSEAISLLEQSLIFSRNNQEIMRAIRDVKIERRNDSLNVLGYKRERITIPIN